MRDPKLQKQAQWYVSEYMKCQASFDYFCRNYVYLELPGGDVLFNPYAKQSELIDLITREHYVITLKSRQIGISTVIQAYSAWLAIFFDNAVVGIISKDGKEATDFSRTIRGMIEKLPDWLKPKKGTMGRGFNKKTEQSFILTNGSKVFSSPVAPNAPQKTLRGKAITFLVIDEAAFVNYIDDAWTAMVPALSTNQKQAKAAGIPYGTILLSTPNKTVGVGKFFYQRYTKALDHDDIFKPFTIHWKQIPELAEDPDWYRIQCELFDNDKKKIAQELELKFLPSEGSFFEAETVEKMQNSAREPMKKYKLFNGEAWVWSDPIAGISYLVGVDTASEQGQDKSGIVIFDYETLEQVWEYQGKCKVKDFAKVVIAAISLYPGALVIENNSYGNQVVETLDESEYSDMLYKEKRGNDNIVAGLSTNSKTRPLIIDALYSYFNEFPEIVRSERLALELTGLVSKKNGRVEADIGCYDDLALASGVCFYARKYDSSRLILDTPRHARTSAEITSIIAANDDHLKSVNNANIISHVKENLGRIGEEDGGIVDILEMYNSGNVGD